MALCAAGREPALMTLASFLITHRAALVLTASRLKSAAARARVALAQRRAAELDTPGDSFSRSISAIRAASAMTVAAAARQARAAAAAPPPSPRPSPDFEDARRRAVEGAPPRSGSAWLRERDFCAATLREAAERGDVEAVRGCIDAGVDVSTEGANFEFQLTV